MSTEQRLSLSPGDRGEASVVVGTAHLATTLGSGRAPVFATPALVALMEAAAVACVEDRLEAGQASLGLRIAADHVAPTPIGRTVTAVAVLTEIKGRRLIFAIEARDDRGVVGRGEHVRVVVDREAFLSKLL